MLTTKSLIAKGAFFGTAVIVLYMVVEEVDLRGTLSAWCECLADEPELHPDVIKDAFTKTQVPAPVQAQDHTHPIAAGARSSSTLFVRDMALYAGVQVYVLGMSKTDQRKGMRGTRQWYWAKDTKCENRNDFPLRDDIEFICDVDYYVDMPELLARRSKPTILYTVVPEDAASVSEDNTTFHFEEDGSLTTLVAGGGRYNHHLWDYGMDYIKVQRKRFGIMTKLITYAVERKQVAKHRQLIMLTPVKEFNGLAAYVADYLLEARPLKRFDPVEVCENGEKYIRILVHKEKTMVSTGKPGQFLAATTPVDIDSTVKGVAQLSSTKLMMPQTAGWLGKDERAAAVMLTQYHRSSTGKRPPIVFPVSLGVRTYHYEVQHYTPDDKAKLQAFMNPIVHGAFAPANNVASERRCVEGRINSLKKSEPRYNAFRNRCFEDFANLIVDGVILEPVCTTTVMEKQTKPGQVLSLYKALVAGPTANLMRRLLCHIKGEAYPDVKDPRNISSYNDADKLTMSTFALAMSEHCKQFAWYGPGKTPIEIAARVASICSNADFVNVSDYHRMDGTISYTLRTVDRVVMMKAFSHHRAELNELLDRNVDNLGVLPHGTTFDQGSSHGSGCAATSLFQTLRAAFTSYLAFRNVVRPDGSRFTSQEAFDALGIHLGDDGLDGDLPVANHEWAAKQVGLVLEANVVHRGEYGVQFLARYYSPEVWNGCLDSMCDIKRQMSKFHTTIRLPQNVSAEAKLVEKCMSYVATDGNTPVIGPLCQRVLVLSTYRPKSLFGIGNWWSKFEDSVQYPNRNDGGWMDVCIDMQFPEFDRGLFDSWLAATRNVEEILAAPLCAEPKPPTPQCVEVVVDEQIIEPRSKPDDPVEDNTNTDKSTCSRTTQEEEGERLPRSPRKAENPSPARKKQQRARRKRKSQQRHTSTEPVAEHQPASWTTVKSRRLKRLEKAISPSTSEV